MEIYDRRIDDACRGDKESLSSLLMDHKGIVAAVVTRMIYEKECHRDVIQNIFLKIVTGIEGFRNQCKFSTWIYRIAVNESMECLRKKGCFEKLKQEFSLNDISTLDYNQCDGLETISKKEIIEWVNEILNECPLGEKTAFSLFYHSGFSGKEAAEAMKISEDNFYMKLKVARDRIRSGLKKKGVFV